jgi:hypothetical protein
MGQRLVPDERDRDCDLLMSDDNESVLVKLTRMEGKLDLSNMRHDQHDERFRTIDGRLHAHGNRIGILEAARHLNDGERKGIQLSTKAAWTVGAFVVTLILSVAGLALKVFA